MEKIEHWKKHLLYTFLKSTNFEKCYSLNIEKLMVAFFSTLKFTAKFELVFVLTQENAFSYRFHFKVNRKSIGSSKRRH